MCELISKLKCSNVNCKEKRRKILNLPCNSYHHEAGLSLQCNQGNSVECSLLFDQPEKQSA